MRYFHAIRSHQTFRAFSGLARLLKHSAPALLAGIFLFTAGAGAARASDVIGPTKTLRVAVTLPNSIELFDPNKSFLSTYDLVFMPLFDRLMTFDRNGERIMQAAESVEFSNDGMVINVRLRDDGMWSYGEPVVASDFVRGFERAAARDSYTAHLLNGIRNRDRWAAGDMSQPLGVEAVDARTIRIHLNRPFGYDIANLMNMQANPFPAGERVARPLIASNGPYMVRDIEREKITLVRNTHYRGQKPYFDEIHFLGFSHDVAVDYFIAGKADVLLGPLGKQKKWLLEHHKNGAIDIGLPRKYVIVLAEPNDATPAALREPEFRRALYASLDREAFEKSDTFYRSRRHCGFLPAAIPCNAERQKIWQADGPMATRVEWAKAVVSKFGYSPEKPLKLTLVVATSIRGYPEIAGFVKSSWREIGIDVELVPAATYIEGLRAMRTGKYNLSINSFYQLQPHQYMYSPAIFGEWSYKYGPQSDYVDQLISLMSRSTGPQYARLIEEAERYMMQDMVMLPIASDAQVGFYASNIVANQESMPKLILRYFTHR